MATFKAGGLTLNSLLKVGERRSVQILVLIRVIVHSVQRRRQDWSLMKIKNKKCQQLGVSQLLSVNVNQYRKKTMNRGPSNIKLQVSWKAVSCRSSMTPCVHLFQYCWSMKDFGATYPERLHWAVCVYVHGREGERESTLSASLLLFQRAGHG